jgi:GNAT superfamily N-acetyltransferase
MEGVRTRPMTETDLGAAQQIVAGTYGTVVPGKAHQNPAWLERWRVRAAHLLATDPGGCWVATLAGEPAGFAISFRREDTWFLGSYAVRAEHQGQGIGRLLLEDAERYGRDCPRAMLSASTDPRAEARYRAAGFVLHPQWRFTGVPRIGPELHAESDAAIEAEVEPAPDLDALDREVRGAAHGPDHALLGSSFRLIREPAGYAYLDGEGSPALLCARDTGTAERLLRRALASAAGEITVGHVTAANPWAREIAENAGLTASPAGWLAVRGMGPPAPYLHHGGLL